MTSLDVSVATNLIDLYVDNNNLVELDVSGLTQLGGVSAKRNKLTSVRAVGVGSAMYYYSSYGVINLSDNELGTTALDQFYSDLVNRSDNAGTGINITGNIGAIGDDPSIATAKGYTIIGT